MRQKPSAYDPKRTLLTGAIAEAGGVVAFVQAALNEAAPSKEWKAAEVKARQGELF